MTTATASKIDPAPGLAFIRIGSITVTTAELAWMREMRRDGWSCRRIADAIGGITPRHVSEVTS